MRRLLCLLFCTAITLLTFSACGMRGSITGNPDTSTSGGSKVSSACVQANTRFAFDIFKQLNEEDDDQSIFISPLSISTALTMTYQGAGTTTREAMSKALRYDGIDIEVINRSYQNLLAYLKQVDKKVELNIGNSIWIRQGDKIEEAFLSVNKDVFNAAASELDFSKAESADKINKWISDSTKGKIDKMISPPIPSDIVMYLINAIYFKGDWTEQFEKKNTFDSKFHAGDGSTGDVMMMSRNNKVEYGRGDGYKAVRLPYGKGKVAMYCILPDEGVSIKEFIAGMDSDKWNAVRESIVETDDVLLQLPRFKLEYGIKELKDSLTGLGMGEAFTDSADFSGIRDGVSISNVLHKAVIEVNEEGSEAAAATVVVVKETAMVIDPPAFIADRPFLFFIADDETGMILFMGKLYDVK